MHDVKKTHVLLALVFTFGVLVSPVVANIHTAYAAALTEVAVRFDRIMVNTATTGTVCAKPATAGTEASVKVTFPAGYTVDSTASHHTISTTNLDWPSGASAWLGIGTATLVSGQDVTFPSGDLVVGTLYCFNWTSTSAITNQSSPSSTNTGTVTTQASGPSTIDSATFIAPTISNDQIVVTATVPQAFSFALSGNTDALGTLSTSSVTTSATPRTVTINTNAKSGWQVWAKDSYQGLCSPSIGTCTDGVAASSNQLNTTATGNNRTLSAGTEDYNLGVTSTQAGGSGTLTVATAFVGGSLGKGGGLSATALQSLAASDGTADTAVLTLKNNVAISGTTGAATDYSDTITVVGAGLF